MPSPVCGSDLLIGYSGLDESPTLVTLWCAWKHTKISQKACSDPRAHPPCMGQSLWAFPSMCMVTSRVASLLLPYGVDVEIKEKNFSLKIRLYSFDIQPFRIGS